MIEILQSLLTNFRSGEILDVVVNTIGIGSAVVSWMILKKLFPKLA
jgi:glycopeptide antibiotics resistance protein